MPLFPGKKNIGRNIDTEVASGKSGKQALAIALGVSRKPKKKMAQGGDVKPSMGTAGNPVSREDKGWGAVIFKAQGGQVDESIAAQARKPSKMPLSQPKAVESNIIKPKRVDALGRVLDEREEHLMESAKPMAKGGMINEEESMHAAEEDMAEHPAGLESDNDEEAPAVDEYMASRFAEGGVADDEMEDDHHDSIAAAIMARRQRLAEGGMADLNMNAEEEPNDYDSQNEAALKENYDEDMHSAIDPMDSNEHSDDLSDEDAHDMVSAIRRRMKQMK